MEFSVPGSRTVPPRRAERKTREPMVVASSHRLWHPYHRVGCQGYFFLLTAETLSAILHEVPNRNRNPNAKQPFPFPRCCLLTCCGFSRWPGIGGGFQGESMNTPNWFTRMVAIKDVKPPLHPRTYKPEGIAALAESITEIGLNHPILIDEDDNLLAGQRRLAACKLLGWPTIPAKVVKLDGAAAELATLDENLCREDYIEAERLIALARRKELYEVLHPETRHGGDRTKSKLPKSASCFTKDTAAKTGAAVSTVAHDLTIAENLDPEAATTLVGTPSGDSKAELSALSKLPAAEQRKIAKAVKSGKAKSVRAAKPDAAPELSGGGKQKSDPRAFTRLESQLGACLRAIDALNRQTPASKFHRDAIAGVKTAMTAVTEWQRATR